MRTAPSSGFQPVLSGSLVPAHAGAQRDNLVEKGYADVAAHRHEHRFSFQRAGAGLEMLDEIGGDFLEAGFGADQLCELRPFAFRVFAGGDVFLVFDDFLDVLVQCVDFFAVDVEPREAALVVNRDGGLVVDGILDVVDRDVIAEDAAGVAVFERDGGLPVKPMKEAFGSASRMCFALPKTYSPVFVFRRPFNPLLAAVGFVGDYDHVGAVAEERVGFSRLR